MQIVNGYICMNCCDVDKARLGQDPHQTTNQIQKQIERHVDKLAPDNFGPAVTLGGSLQSTAQGLAPGSATPSGNTGAPGPQEASLSPSGETASSSVNILV